MVPRMLRLSVVASSKLPVGKEEEVLDVSLCLSSLSPRHV